MAQREYKVNTVNGMVRLDLDDGTHTDFMPDQANRFAAMLVAAAHEAVYNDRPPKITMTFHYNNEG